MYIHYARTTNAGGTKLVQLLFCSNDRGRYNITKQTNEFFISKYDWQHFCIPVVSMLKQIPSNQRSYDNEHKVWTILEPKWDALTDIFKALGFQFKSYNNLYTDCVDKDWDGSKATYVKDIPKVEDFFYENVEQNIVSNDGPTKEQIEEKIRFYLQIPNEIKMTTVENDLKKLYRRAAMKYHPDLNNGDGSRMTELNYYWQEWQKVRTNVS